MIKNKYIRFFIIMILSAGLFLVCTMPTRDIFSVFTVSEVRPAAVLNPILGIAFGLPAALGCTIANLIADALSGYSVVVLIEGFFGQFLYGFVPYLLWKYFTKGEDHIYRLNSVSRLIKFTITMLINCIMIGFIVGLIIYTNFGASLLSSGFFVFLNNFNFCMLLGCPLMLLINNIIRRIRHISEDTNLSIEEYNILHSILVQIAMVIVITISVYGSFAGQDVEVYDIWNKIYIYSSIAVNSILVLNILHNYVINKKIKQKLTLD